MCFRCLNTFKTEKSLAFHHEYCKSHEAIQIELPEKRTKISTCQPNPEESYTKRYQKHTPSGFCYHIKCFDNTLYYQEPVIFVKECDEDDVAEIFIDTLEKNIKDIYKQFKFSKGMTMTMHDKMVYDNSTLCHICNEELCKDRVHDHCHLTGKFRGAAHKDCDIKYMIPKFFPVVFHNFSGYVSHLFIKTLENSEGDISCIPNNEEHYISFTKQVIVDKFVNEEGKGE